MVWSIHSKFFERHFDVDGAERVVVTSDDRWFMWRRLALANDASRVCEVWDEICN